MFVVLRRNKVMVIVLSVICMLCWGVTPVLLKIGLKNVDPLIGLAIRTIFTIVIIFSVLFINGNIGQIKHIPLVALILIGTEAFLATFVGDLAYYAAIKHGDVSLVTIIISTSPIITLICSVIILSETITLLKILGAVLAILGIILTVSV